MTDAEFYQLRKRSGVCTKCGREDAYTMAGRSLCYECAEKARETRRRRYEEKPQECRDAVQRYRRKMLDKKLCPNCGRPVREGAKACARCLRKSADCHHKQLVAKGINFPRGDNGICYLCNKKPALEGKRVCEECYKKEIELQKMVNEYNKQNGYGPFEKGVRNYWILQKAKNLQNQKSV